MSGVLLTTSEAAARLGRSRDWVREQINAGRLPAQTFLPPGGERRSYRIEVNDLAAFARQYLGTDPRDQA